MVASPRPRRLAPTFLATSLLACGPTTGPRGDAGVIECRFPSGRTCRAGAICMCDPPDQCNTCLCEVTGEISRASTVPCDAGRD
jgi:hypothetical protein